MTMRLDPNASVLVVVDVQDRLAPAMPAARLDALVRASAILLESARQLGVRVVATEQYPQGLGRTIPPLADKLGANGVTPIAKTTFSAVDEPEFMRALERGPSWPRHAVVIGMETHICVYQTARDLVALGLEVHVPIDGVASRKDDHLETGLRLCERVGAVTTTAETVAFDWLRRAGTDAFKAISRVVR